MLKPTCLKLNYFGESLLFPQKTLLFHVKIDINIHRFSAEIWNSPTQMVPWNFQLPLPLLGSVLRFTSLLQR